MKLQTFLHLAAGVALIGASALVTSAQPAPDRPMPDRPGRFQGPGGPMAPMIEGLSPEQRQSFREAFQRLQERTRELNLQLREARERLHQAAWADQVNEERVYQLAQRLARLEAGLALARSRALAHVRPQLSREQLERLRTLRQRLAHHPQNRWQMSPPGPDRPHVQEPPRMERPRARAEAGERQRLRERAGPGAPAWQGQRGRAWEADRPPARGRADAREGDAARPRQPEPARDREADRIRELEQELDRVRAREMERERNREREQARLHELERELERVRQREMERDRARERGEPRDREQAPPPPARRRPAAQEPRPDDTAPGVEREGRRPAPVPREERPAERPEQR